MTRLKYSSHRCFKFISLFYLSASVFFASTNFLLAEIYKLESFSFTTHHFAGAVVNQYKNKDSDGIFKSTTKETQGNSENSSVDFSEIDVRENFSLRLGFYRPILNFKSYKLNSNLFLSFGKFKLSYPDGFGVFVERIDVNSSSIELAPELTISTTLFKNKIKISSGVGYSFIHSKEKFKFGSWNIKETKNFGSAYRKISFSYLHAADINFSFYFDTLFRQNNTDIGIGIKFPIPH